MGRRQGRDLAREARLPDGGRDLRAAWPTARRTARARAVLLRASVLEPVGLASSLGAALRAAWVLWALVAAAPAARAGEILAGPVPAVVDEVVDGDTLRVRVRIWLGQNVVTQVRLAGVDAPELRGACVPERELAHRARAFVASRLGDGGAAEARVRLRDVRHGKFARRVVARVETAAGVDLSAALLAAGLARPYDGGRRASWCD